jgi:hypothetical protein
LFQIGTMAMAYRPRISGETLKNRWFCLPGPALVNSETLSRMRTR